jgi:ribosome-associated protein
LAKKQQNTSKNLRDLVIEGISDRKGLDIVTLDLTEIKDTVADYFIITHGDSSTQVNAIFQSVQETTKKNGFMPYHSEGTANSEWIIIDFVDVVVHIFYRETRQFYQLEDLWSDAKITQHGEQTAIKSAGVRPLKKIMEEEKEYVIKELNKKMPPRRTATKKTPVKKAIVKKSYTKAPAKEKTTDKDTDKKPAARRSYAKPDAATRGVRKTPDTKAFAKIADTEKTASKKPATKRTTAKPEPAKKAYTKASSAKKAPARKAPAKKSITAPKRKK